MTNSLLLRIQMSEHNSLPCGGELHDNLPHSQPTFLHIIIPSWQLTVSMHQILFLLCANVFLCHSEGKFYS